MTAPLPEPGEVFQSRYRLESVLGEGGFARVFVATDTELKRLVAIKILRLRGDAHDDLHAVRFEREARHVAQLSHPHIVTMFDYGRTDDGLLFTVFELVGGMDLFKMMSSGRMEERAVIRIMLQVLDALSAAHKAGLLHRDIKPANIQVFEYMGDPLCVKLLDFGIAKTTEGDASLTATGMVVGTPRYMAPEALYNESIGPYTDIYSLGLVAYEMLLGEPSDHLRRLVNKQTVEVPPEHPITPGLRRVLNRMLERRTTDRYASARAVMKELAVVGSSPPAPAVAEVDPTMEPTRVSPRLAGRPPAAPADTTGERSGPLRTIVMFAAGLIFGGACMVALFFLRGDSPAKGERDVQMPRALLSQPPEKKSWSDEIVVTHLDTGFRIDASSEGPDGAAVEPAGGCSGEAATVGTRRVSKRDGLNRFEWVQHVPQGYDPNTRHPLVVLLHDDAGGSAAEALSSTGLAATADEHGFVLVVPEDDAIAYTWTDDEDIDNIEFVVEAARESLCIDAERIFAVGHGAGGWGVEKLSCRPWVKGIATVSFVPEVAKFTCEPRRRIPTLVILPMKSGFLPPQGGPDCVNNAKISFDEFESMWIERNGCGSKRTKFAAHAADYCIDWDCEARFASCRIAGGRRWAGAPPRQIDVLQCDGPSTRFPYNETIWDFFAAAR